MVIPVLRRQTQEDHSVFEAILCYLVEFQTSLGYTELGPGQPGSNGQPSQSSTKESL